MRPAPHRRVRLGGDARGLARQLDAQDDRAAPAETARRGSARTSPTTRRSTTAPSRVLPPRGRLDARDVLRAPREARRSSAASRSRLRTSTTGAGPSSRPRSTWRCARPGLSTRRGARRVPRSRVTFVSSTRADRPRRDWLALYPDAALQARPDAGMDGRADREARRPRQRRHGRPQGPVQGNDRRQPGRRGSLPPCRRGVPDAWIEDPALTPETDRCSSRTATGSRGTRRSTRGPTSRRCRSHRKLPELKPSRFGSLQRLFEFYDAARRRASRSTAAASSSSASAAAQIQLLAVALPPRRPERRGARRLQRERAAHGLPTSPLAPLPERYGFGAASG